MWNNKLQDLFDRAESTLKPWVVTTLFLIIGSLIFVLLKLAKSSKRIYMTKETRRLFKINDIYGLFNFVKGVFKDEHDIITINITTFEEDGEYCQNLDLSDFLEDYTDFKIANKNDRLFYGPK